MDQTLEDRGEIAADIIPFKPKNWPNSCEECSIFAYDRETPLMGDCHRQQGVGSIGRHHPSSLCEQMGVPDQEKRKMDIMQFK